MSSRDLSEEAPDPAWMAEEVERRREHGERIKVQERIARLARREREPLSTRLSHVESAAVLASTVSAGSIAGSEGSSGSTPGTKILHRAEADELALGGEDRREVGRVLHIVKDAIEKLEQVVDAHRGLAGSRPAMDTQDLDELLLSYEGRTPEDVSLLEPSLGSPAAVRKSRAKLERHREDGTRITKKASILAHTDERQVLPG